MKPAGQLFDGPRRREKVWAILLNRWQSPLIHGAGKATLPLSAGKLPTFVETLDCWPPVDGRRIRRANPFRISPKVDA